MPDTIAADELERIEVHVPLGGLHLVGHRWHRRERLELLQTVESLLRSEVGPFEVREFGVARDGIDGDADERLDERTAAGDESAESVHRKQIVPGLVEPALPKVKHCPCGQSSGEFPAFLHVR